MNMPSFIPADCHNAWRHCRTEYADALRRCLKAVEERDVDSPRTLDLIDRLRREHCGEKSLSDALPPVQGAKESPCTPVQESSTPKFTAYEQLFADIFGGVMRWVQADHVRVVAPARKGMAMTALRASLRDTGDTSPGWENAVRALEDAC